MDTHDTIVFWLMFFGVVTVSGFGYFAITRSARREKLRRQGFPGGWLSEDERRDWSDQDEGIVVISGPSGRVVGDEEGPWCPPEAHVRS